MYTAAKQTVSRISVSLPENVLNDLDEMVVDCGFGSRSQALAEMINRQVAEHKTRHGNTIMAGTINLVYDHSVNGLKRELTDLQYTYVDEVISSLSVNLVDAKTLEVILVQGPADKLKMIADQMISCKGVLTGKLLMSAAIMPPLHPLPETK